MTLPLWGKISHDDIAYEFSHSGVYSLGNFAYYIGKSGSGSEVIKESDFYGATSAAPISGSGGNQITTNGQWKLHIITNTNGNTCFSVDSAASGGYDNTIHRLIVGGGAGGG
ncbi:MAG: hypothetical protein L7T19_08090, partial [Pseudomonadales bacterium]|nr:hypothetical protein [Pseudomonadales bacterium]